MKFKLLPILLIMCTSFVGATYSWSGSLYIGDKLQVNDLTIHIDMNKIDNTTAAVVYKDGQVKALIYENESKEIENLNIEVHKFNDYVILSITSEKPFTLSFNETKEMKDYSNEINALKEENAKLKQENKQLKKQVEQLTNENKALKRRVSDLEKQLKDLNAQDVSKLQAQINNLTKENRELKERIANQTQLINSLKGENNFLEQQNKEYKTLISTLVEGQAQKSEKNYIEKAKKERLIGSIIIKSLLVGGVVVGLVGYGLYRKKRSWELA
ncbi:hypothetical protein [Archaeoglobus sp.]